MHWLGCPVERGWAIHGSGASGGHEVDGLRRGVLPGVHEVGAHPGHHGPLLLWGHAVRAEPVGAERHVDHARLQAVAVHHACSPDMPSFRSEWSPC